MVSLPLASFVLPLSMLAPGTFPGITLIAAPWLTTLTLRPASCT